MQLEANRVVTSACSFQLGIAFIGLWQVLVYRDHHLTQTVVVDDEDQAEQVAAKAREEMQRELDEAERVEAFWTGLEARRADRREMARKVELDELERLATSAKGGPA
jgi:hypothetical protein